MDDPEGCGGQGGGWAAAMAAVNASADDPTEAAAEAAIWEIGDEND